MARQTAFLQRCIQHLHDNRANVDNTGANTFIEELRKWIEEWPSVSQKTRLGLHGDRELECAATELWNTCTRIGRENAHSSANRVVARFPTLCRVAAVQMLDVCQWSSSSSSAASAIHLMKLALKTAKYCIDNDESSAAKIVLQQAADHKLWLSSHTASLTAVELEVKQDLELQWTVGRMALAWREGRLDVAESLYNQIRPSDNAHQQDNNIASAKASSSAHYSAHARLSASILLLSIGQGLLHQESFTDAVKWLEQAHDMCQDRFTPDATLELSTARSTIVNGLVMAYLSSGTKDHLSKAAILASTLENGTGKVQLSLPIQLELIAKTPTEIADENAYPNILRTMISRFDGSETSYKLIVYHIRELHKRNARLGIEILDKLVAQILPLRQSGWLNTIVVTMIWMMRTLDCTSQQDLDRISTLLSKSSEPLLSAAALAAQMLIWHEMDKSFNNKRYSMAEAWCRVALDPKLADCGQLNTAKFQRKCLACATEREDGKTVKSMVSTMSPTTQNEPATLYLIYKAALRLNDHELATKTLASLSALPDMQNHLMACTSEAQRSGNKALVVEGLQQLCKSVGKDVDNVHWPALFRCTIVSLKSCNGDPEEICLVFDNAVSAMRRPRSVGSTKGKDFDLQELQWFSQNAYNLGVENSGQWPISCTVQILTACVEIMDILKQQVGPRPEMLNDLQLKAMFCHFLAGSALISMARTDDDLQDSLQAYLSMRQHVLSFGEYLRDRPSSLEPRSLQDLTSKYAVLLAFDFEAATALKKWDELLGVVERAVECRDLDTYKCMGDCLLRANAPPQVLFDVLRELIDRITVLETDRPERLAKYVRCLFQAMLPVDDALCETLLDEVLDMIRSAQNESSMWPREVVEWIATTSFNHAIDLFGRDQLDRSRRWVRLSIDVACECNDGGYLKALLKEKALLLRSEE